MRLIHVQVVAISVSVVIAAFGVHHFKIANIVFLYLDIFILVVQVVVV